MYGLAMSFLLLSYCDFCVFSPGVVVVACPVLLSNHLAQKARKNVYLLAFHGQFKYIHAWLR